MKFASLFAVAVLAQTDSSQIVAPTLSADEMQIWNQVVNAVNSVNYNPCKSELSVVMNQAQNAFNNYGIAPNFFNTFKRIGNQSGDIEEANQFRSIYANFSQILNVKEKEYDDYVAKTKAAILKQKQDAKAAEELAAQIATQQDDGQSADEVVTALSDEEQMSMYGVDTNAALFKQATVSLLIVGSLAMFL